MPKRTHIVSHLALLYGLCLLSFSTGFAQKVLRQQPAPQSSSTVRFQHLGSEQGLPQNSVRRILQDHFGYLWFGTEDGLARFDGYGFTVFRHDPQDSTSLSNSYITVLLEDRTGTLWIGTNGGGLNRFDRAKGTFTHYKNNSTDSASLSDNNVRSLLEDRAGTMWVGTFGNGLNRFDRTKNSFLRYKHDPKNPSSLSNNTVRALVEDRFGTFWVGTDGGLNRFDRATGHCSRFQHDPADSTSLSHNVILSLIEEQPPSSSSISNILWMGTWEGGLNRFDCATGKFVHFQNKPDDPTSLSN
jgi:ligand-binding sensor domain-containing protein